MRNKKIILIGDSITAGFDVKKFLPEFNIINKGISAQVCEDILNRLDSDVINYNPDLVFLLIGTNDFARGFSDESISQSIKNILTKLSEKLKGAEIFATTILPTRDLEDRPNERINSVNSEIKKTADSLNLKVLDLHSEMKDEEGKLKKEFTDDGLHLTQAAYKRWAEILKTILV